MVSFDNPAVLDNLAEGLTRKRLQVLFDYAAFKEEQYDKLAAPRKGARDMEYIFITVLKTNIMNRRTFMQKTGLIMSGLTLSPLIGKSYPPYTDKPPPSNKVKGSPHRMP